VTPALSLLALLLVALRLAPSRAAIRLIAVRNRS